jgi:hypothetical protein
MVRVPDGVGLRAVARQPLLRTTLLALLAVDLVFISLHFAQLWAEWSDTQGPFSGERYSLENEGGPSETWEAAKTILCVLALADVGRRTRQPVYAAVAFGFTAALLDNVLQLHERGGEWLASGLQGAARLFEAAPQAIGELGIFLAQGVLIAGVLLMGFRRSDRGHWAAGAVGVALLLALAAVGIGLDLVHAALGGLRRLMDRGLGTLEDGGELLVLSVTAAYAVGLSRLVRPAVAS